MARYLGSRIWVVPLAVGLLVGCLGSTQQAAVVEPTADPTAAVANNSVSVAGPSQSAADAARDGVIAELAMLPLAERSDALLSVAGVGGTWVLSVMPADTDTPVLGDPAGVYALDYIAATDYGEILFINETGAIEQAIPLSGSKPTWMIVEPAVVYAGRVGDGGQPHNLFVRIDLSSNHLDLVQVAGGGPSPGEGFVRGARFVDSTEVALWGQAQQVLSTSAAPERTEARSWIGPTFVDVGALDTLMDLALAGR